MVASVYSVWDERKGSHGRQCVVGLIMTANVLNAMNGTLLGCELSVAPAAAVCLHVLPDLPA
jgi:hypothetical protein